MVNEYENSIVSRVSLSLLFRIKPFSIFFVYRWCARTNSITISDSNVQRRVGTLVRQLLPFQHKCTFQLG
ncbi:hypothetical protein HOLleu_40616 [Holothuria leucospilota]|uniref:Uncharacterized protein n=1 Tax=Holothuria leucospilota TaxID=206669 RepID=A0A9Q1BBT6_HOLLE|nr:hypothetical protein HOLleu_40616 [Holothuria leucospilota]